jgi:DNA-binding CsgD family transcriptional regulator
MAVDYFADPDIPWRAIFELFESTDPKRSPEEYIAPLLTGLNRVIPFDIGCGLLRADGQYIASYGLQAKTVADYNDYYLSTMTFIPQSLAEAYEEGSKYHLLPVVWDLYRDTEFVEDFCRPINLAKTLTYFLPHHPYSLALHRGSSTVRNTDTEITTLRIINAQLSRFLRMYEDPLFGSASIPQQDELRARFPVLSRRESAVVLQTCRGMSARAISEREGLSRRTIESQLVSAYIKMNAKNKRDLISKVMTQPREAPQTEVLFAR